MVLQRSDLPASEVREEHFHLNRGAASRRRAHQDSPSGLRTGNRWRDCRATQSALCKLERSAGSRCAAISLLPPHPSPVSAPDSIPAADAGAVAQSVVPQRRCRVSAPLTSRDPAPGGRALSIPADEPRMDPLGTTGRKRMRGQTVRCVDPRSFSPARGVL
jgi:hypothetical protein